MRILGIDPGTSIIGFGIIETDGDNFSSIDYGCIKTNSADNIGQKLITIISDLKTIISTYQPDSISLEKLFFKNNAKTAMTVSEARGAIIHYLSEANLELHQYTPLQIKSSVCGYGKAPKQQIQEMVKLLLDLKEKPTPDDAADALAAAICHANHIKYLEIQNA